MATCDAKKGCSKFTIKTFWEQSSEIGIIWHRKKKRGRLSYGEAIKKTYLDTS